MNGDFRRKCRVTARWMRRVVLAMVVAFLSAFLWFNRIGMPDFVTRRLVSAFSARGIQFHCARLRLSIGGSLIAQNVSFHSTANRPVVSAREIGLKPDYWAALRGQFKVNGIFMRDGGILLPVSPANTLSLDRVQAALRFGPDDTVALDGARADFQGTELLLSGDIIHAASLRQWPLFQGRAVPSTGRLSTVLRQIRLGGPRSIQLNVNCDARDIHSLNATLFARAFIVVTPWGGAQQLELSAKLTAPADALTIAVAKTNSWRNVAPFQLNWTARAARIITKKFAAHALAAQGFWLAPDAAISHFAADLDGHLLEGNARLDIATQNYRAGLQGTLGMASLRPFLTTSNAIAAFGHLSTTVPARVSLAFRGNLKRGFGVRGSVALDHFSLRRQSVDRFATDFSFTNRVLALFHPRLSRGTETMTASNVTFDFVRRVVSFTNGCGTADPESVARAIGPETGKLMEPYRFLQPPEVRVNGQAPFRDIEGPADVDDANLKFDIVRGAPFQCLKFQAQNVMGVVWWRARQVLLTNVQARAYGGNMAGWAAFDFDVPHEPVRDCRLSVAVTNLDVPRLAADLRNVPAIRPLLPIVTTDNPVAVSRMKRVNAILRGSLRLNPNIQAQGSVAVGPFAVRDQPVDHFAADFSFTNRVLAFSGPRLRRGTETMTASNIIVDLNRRVIRFINGCSTADPESVARAIGPETGKLMEPYHFLQPPEVRVNGQAPFRDINGPADVDDANLKFDIVRGAPFQCLKFQAQSVMGVVWWRAQQVLLTNVQARAYGGNLAGWAAFDFGVPHDGADYRFNATAQNLDLAALARGLTGRSTRLKGEVRGSVAVTRGDTRNWRGMIGSGNVHVQNGFLWDIPLFGVFSPLLDQISPGLGSIEASDAGGNFRVGGGGVSSDSFQFHSTLMRLDYSGGVTFDQTIHATVTAQLLRDMPGLGQFFSVVFWPVGKIFEYNVTGTLGHPNMQSVVPFLPGLLQFPLHPLRTLQNLVPQDPPPDAHKNSAR